MQFAQLIALSGLIIQFILSILGIVLAVYAIKALRTYIKINTDKNKTKSQENDEV